MMQILQILYTYNNYKGNKTATRIPYAKFKITSIIKSYYELLSIKIVFLSRGDARQSSCRGALLYLMVAMNFALILFEYLNYLNYYKFK